MRLENISRIQTGLNLIRKKGKLYERHHNYKLITLKSFSKTGELVDDSFEDFIAGDLVADKYLTKKGDILIRLRSPNFAVFIDKEKHEGLLISSLMAKITPNKNIDGRYLTNYINSGLVQRAMMKKIESKTVLMLNVKKLRNLKVILPSASWQQTLNKALKQSRKEIALLKRLLSLKTKLNNELLNTFLNSEADK